MSPKRVWTLMKNDVLHGSKDVVLVMALAVPVLLAVFVNLAFGNIFTDRAKLGVYDEGDTPLPAALAGAESLILKDYASQADLKTATSGGVVDMGIVLPADFETRLAEGTVSLTAYVWGESPAKNRLIIGVVLADALREMTGAEPPVVVETVALGGESDLPWSDRLLPLTVLMAVFFGGLMLPASSLINEKQHRTLEALNVTPATIGDIFIAKGIIGAVLAIFMGVLTLAICASFGSSTPAIILVLGLGAIMAAEIGLLAGAFVNDMNTLFALWKFGGVLLFAPALVFMFPQIPSWVGYIFPTYYVVRPLFDLSVSGLGFGGVAIYIIVLAVIVFALGLVVAAVVRRLSAQALRLG